MLEYLQEIWNTNYMPHGHCYFWEPGIMWSHAISDSIIALAYFIIPISLVKIVRKRKDFTYIWMIVLFAIFILGCGATHVMDVINIWEPFYRIDSAIRIITAIASIGTALLLIRVTPQLILFPSSKKWKEMNEELHSLNEQLEQKVAERTKNYQEIAAKFEFLTDTIPQIVWTTDDTGETNYMNKTWFDYTGLDKSDKGAFNWNQVLHPKDLKRAAIKWHQSLERSEKLEMEVRIRNINSKEYRWYLARSIPMKDYKGHVSMWLGTATDIHDQKMQNEELIRTNDELDNFVYVASHDLKTPINNLDGLLKILDNRIPENARKEVAPVQAMMSKSIEQLKMTINDLADISQLQRQNLADDLGTLSLQDLIEEFKINHHVLMKETGARIESNLEVQRLYFSRKYLRSILDNLLSNALKYRKPGCLPRINVTSYATDKHYVLQVQDNGLGIKPEHQKRIFDMFRRFHSQSEGTGVGLNIVKRIVEKHQGSIQVQSEPEKGSIFRIFLPKEAKLTDVE